MMRRLYVYVVSGVALVVLAFGLATLGVTLLEAAYNGGDPFNRAALAGYTAAVVVSFPVWAIHMWFGGRFARRDPAERASAIRPLYVYLPCMVSSIGATIALAHHVNVASPSHAARPY